MKFPLAHALTLCSVFVISTQTFGQARFIVEGDGLPTPLSGHLPIPLDTETEFTISVFNEGPAEVAGPRLTLLDFAGISTSAGDNVALQSWEWIFPNADNHILWATVGLPSPQAATMALGLSFPHLEPKRVTANKPNAQESVDQHTENGGENSRTKLQNVVTHSPDGFSGLH